MLLTIISKYDGVVIINVIFTVFFNCGYELRKLKISYKRFFSIFIALKHRFLKEENNVTSVFYILSKADFLIKLIIFNITQLNLACLDRGICFYINVFLMYIFPFYLVVLFIYTHMT